MGRLGDLDPARLAATEALLRDLLAQERAGLAEVGRGLLESFGARLAGCDHDKIDVAEDHTRAVTTFTCSTCGGTCEVSDDVLADIGAGEEVIP